MTNLKQTPFEYWTYLSSASPKELDLILHRRSNSLKILSTDYTY